MNIILPSYFFFQKSSVLKNVTYFENVYQGTIFGTMALITVMLVPLVLDLKPRYT